MKVLFLTNVPAFYKVRFFNELGKNVDLTVLFERRKASNRPEKWYGNDFSNFRAVFLKGVNVGEESAFCLRVIKYIRKKYSIVIGSYATPTAMLLIMLLKLLHVRYYLSTDGGYVKNDNVLKRWIKHFFISGAYRYFSPSKGSDEYFVYYGAKRDKIYRYPFTSVRSKDVINGILSDDEKEKLKETLGVRGRKIVLGVGQFIPRKGWDTLLKAADMLPRDISFYLIGGKPTEQYLNFCQRTNLTNLHFLDFMDSEKLAQYYKVADLFVLPTREDIWGLVINEAMSYGLPIITTFQCVAGEELVKENGYLFDCEKYDDLAKKIELGLENQKQLSEKSLECAKMYTVEKMAISYLQRISGDNRF